VASTQFAPEPGVGGRWPAAALGAARIRQPETRDGMVQLAAISSLIANQAAVGQDQGSAVDRTRRRITFLQWSLSAAYCTGGASGLLLQRSISRAGDPAIDSSSARVSEVAVIAMAFI
jgi:hypothetical protein